MSNGYINRASRLFSHRVVEPEDNNAIHSMRDIMDNKASSLRRPNIEGAPEAEKPPTPQMTLEQLNDKYWEMNISLSNAKLIIDKLTREKDKVNHELEIATSKVIKMKANYDTLASQHSELTKTVNRIVRHFNTLAGEHAEIEKSIDEQENKQNIMEGDIKQLEEAYHAQISINDGIQAISQKQDVLDKSIVQLTQNATKHAKQTNLVEEKLYKLMDTTNEKLAKYDEDITQLRYDVDNLETNKVDIPRYQRH